MKGCQPLTKEEKNLFMKELNRSIKNELCKARILLIFAIGVTAGLRISEILHLRVKHIYKNNEPLDRIYLPRQATKGKREGRYQKLNEEIKPILEEYLYIANLKEKDWLFPSPTNSNKPLSRQMVWKVFQQIAVKINLTKKIGTHFLRKTFGNEILSLTDGDLRKTQKALGHKRIDSTIQYLLDPDQEEIDEAIASLKLRG